MPFRRLLHHLTHWETWDYRVKLIPLAPVWLWHSLRAGSFWFFTPANPTITFGGFEGEGKREIYGQLPPAAYPTSLYLSPDVPFGEVAAQLRAAGFAYPVAVKPDVGMMGLLFRRIDTADALRAYHERMPVDYIIQEFVDLPVEVSVFYYRFPGAEQGTITGFVRKDFLEVVGDGVSTLGELMGRYPRVAYRLSEMRAKHAHRLTYVVPAGEPYRLSNALNQTRGGQLVSLANEKDEQLLRVFDELSHYAGHFYFGRYDVKCRSVDALKRGEFSILEFNGAGAAPHHVYGNGHSLWQAYGIILHHWSVLARIARQQHRAGVPYWPFGRGWTFFVNAQKHLQLLKRLDTELPDYGIAADAPAPSTERQPADATPGWRV